MQPRQPQLAKPCCLFEGEKAMLIENLLTIIFVLFNKYIFRKFESHIFKGREAMALSLYQYEATHNLMNLRITLLKFSENVYVEKHKV